MELSSLKLKKVSYISGGNFKSLKTKQKHLPKVVSYDVFFSLYNSKA